jgi:hypothetical protein
MYLELAGAVGVSESTVRRQLSPGPLVDLFIVERKTIRRVSEKRGHVVNDTTLFKVRLDEPIFGREGEGA